MGQRVSRSDFIWSYTDQPHSSRRGEIVRKYPEIKKLFGIDPSFKYVVSALVLTQIAACYFLKGSLCFDNGSFSVSKLKSGWRPEYSQLLLYRTGVGTKI